VYVVACAGDKHDSDRKANRPSSVFVWKPPRAALVAAFFRFLRQPSRPKPPRPVAKSGKAAGRGVVSSVKLWSAPVPQVQT
jgi:hypothetical protein